MIAAAWSLYVTGAFLSMLVVSMGSKSASTPPGPIARGVITIVWPVFSVLLLLMLISDHLRSKRP